MLARGSVQDGQLNKHCSKVNSMTGNLEAGIMEYFQIVSGEPLGLGEVGEVKAKSRLFIFLHGSFMIGAWVCAASLGIMIAR